MKKTYFFLFAVVSVLTASAQMAITVTDPVEWINPLMGTDSKPSLSSSNTSPSICNPWCPLPLRTMPRNLSP